MSLVIDNAVDIDAAPEAVWGVITDFDRYAEWNPLAPQCSSSLVPGDPIDMVVYLRDGTPRRTREWIKTHTPGHEFSYTMKPVPLRALSSLRQHTVTALEDGRTRYTSHFELHGWLFPMIRLLYGRALHRGFNGMTEGIRTQAERR